MSKEQTRSRSTAHRAPTAPGPVADTTNPFEAVTLFFDNAADHLGLSDEMRDVLRTSYRELAVQVPVRMDDGALQVFGGYRV
ncbi:MAG: hypothetical protein ACRDHO_04080, partial [Actinomycetota bacterium]